MRWGALWGCIIRRSRRCVERALAYGPMAALDDRARPGKEATITAEAKAWVVNLACRKAKDLGYPHELWTTRLLARHVREQGPAEGHACLAKLAQGTVCKILNEQERGGFVALHFAAVESRVRCVAAFAPVTNLLALREFAGIEQDSPSVLRVVKSLALVNSAEKLAGRPIWICIGNYDQRVNTDDAIALTRRVVEASVAEDKPANVEIRVLPSEGYQVRVHDNGHGIPVPSAHKEAAEWILARMGEAK